MSEPFIPKTAWTPEWYTPNAEESQIRAGDVYEPDDDEISDAIIERLRKRDDHETT